VNENAEKRITWKGWLSLLFLLLTFSGVLMNAPAPWKALDFQVLVGQFGQIAPGVDFTGKGGTGAKDGLLVALTLIPTLMFAMGLIQVAESMGALDAAGKIFQPLLRPILGIPGKAGIAFISSFTSSDAASVMTKRLFDENGITDDERTTFVAYQYAGSAPVTNTIGMGAPLLPISVLPVGVVILIIIAVKIIGANLVRTFLKYLAAKKSAGVDSHE
jgi:Uncharacterized protein conserved in bacteria